YSLYAALTGRGLKRPASHHSLHRAIPIAVTIFALGTLLSLLSKIPDVPYNFRNLFHPSYPYLSALLIAAALVWSAVFLSWIPRKLAGSTSVFEMFPAWILLYGVVGWVVVFFDVDALRPC